jgi:hypothetical protein
MMASSKTLGVIIGDARRLGYGQLWLEKQVALRRLAAPGLWAEGADALILAPLNYTGQPSGWPLFAETTFRPIGEVCYECF